MELQVSFIVVSGLPLAQVFVALFDKFGSLCLVCIVLNDLQLVNYIEQYLVIVILSKLLTFLCRPRPFGLGTFRLRPNARLDRIHQLAGVGRERGKEQSFAHFQHLIKVPSSLSETCVNYSDVAIHLNFGVEIVVAQHFLLNILNAILHGVKVAFQKLENFRHQFRVIQRVFEGQEVVVPDVNRAVENHPVLADLASQLQRFKVVVYHVSFNRLPLELFFLTYNFFARRFKRPCEVLEGWLNVVFQQRFNLSLSQDMVSFNLVDDHLLASIRVPNVMHHQFAGVLDEAEKFPFESQFDDFTREEFPSFVSFCLLEVMLQFFFVYLLLN